MIEFLAEVVVLSFTMGGLIGAVVALKLVAPRKVDVTVTGSTLESGTPK